GFHPELTGRDNIYLNGAILGMRRHEVDAKLDEIIAFSGIKHHIDTPVKRYSSGMYVRLAFAVAAHLEPEILIVDEVLAVGDAQFQKKCLGKMQDVARGGGRTVLFVSHNTGAMQAICRTGLWLHRGRVQQHGTVAECLAAYLESSANIDLQPTVDIKRPHITGVTLDHAALTQGRLRLRVEFKSPFPLKRPVLGVTIFTRFGQPVSGGNGRMAGESWHPPEASAGVIIAEIARLPLHSDTYRVSLYLGDATQDYDVRHEALDFDYISPHFHPETPRLDVIGPVDLPWRWSFAPSDGSDR
ncbi:MAG: ABC transporter ATP-binding protein, partial [Opitutaceae bacterium]|nr:ABC transporter ATP-binding protein [Opitutaceae bacterium]